MIPSPLALLLRVPVLVLILSLLLNTAAFSGAPPLPSQPAKQNHDAVVILESDGSANTDLYSLLQSEDSSTNVVLEGFVSKRRALGSSLVFLDIVPWRPPAPEESADPTSTSNQRQVISEEELASIAPVQAILRREFWDEKRNGSSFDVYHKVLQPGTNVVVIGTAGPSRIAGEAMVFVSQAKYQLANANPQHLRNVLKFARDGLLDFEEVSRALPKIDREELLESVIGSPGQSCGELASVFLSRFPPKFLLNPSHLMGATNSQKVALLPPVPLEYMKPMLRVNRSDLEDQNEEILSVTAALERKVSSEKSTSDEPETFPCTISAWVQNRRRYSNNVTVLELVDSFSSLASSSGADASDPDQDETLINDDFIEARNSRLKNLWKGRIYSVLHPESLEESQHGDQAEIYGNILCSGARVALQGYLVTGKPSKKDNDDSSNVATLWVSNCRLLRSSWRPSVVRNVLDLLAAGRFDVEEASECLKLPYAQVEDIASGTEETSSTDRQWMAAELSKSLQGENSRIGKISEAMQQSLDTFSSVRYEHPIQEIEATSSDPTKMGPKASQILESSGTPLRTSPEGSRWQRKKKPQLEWMLGQIEQVIRSHPEYGQRPLRLVDVGGGKGNLSNLLAETFGEDLVTVQVVDISQSAIRNGQMRAMRRGLGNIRYDAQDATTLDVSGVDVVVALHACGALSDVALGHAVRESAGFVICPCCFRSNPQLRVALPASLTDDGNSESLKATSSNDIELVTVDEWLNVESAPYESLKQLAELQGDIGMSSRAMHSICGLRARAVQRCWQNSRWRSEVQILTKIKSFPIGFSTRNLCLVGEFETIT